MVSGNQPTARSLILVAPNYNVFARAVQCFHPILFGLFCGYAETALHVRLRREETSGAAVTGQQSFSPWQRRNDTTCAKRGLGRAFCENMTVKHVLPTIGMKMRG